MGLIDWFLGLFDRGLKLDELARRLGVSEKELAALEPTYREFSIEKRSGGRRWIQAPDSELKAFQRRILRRLLDRLRAHPSARGFERGESIVTNAIPHRGKKIVVRMDLVDYFPSTRSDRVRKYFRRIGWSRKVSRRLTELLAYDGGLPQGAPTSPRLSNLVNYRLDARLAGMARKWGASYTRYADDLTFSFEFDDPKSLRAVIGMTGRVVRQFGYRLHVEKKLRIRRRHQCQLVTGLVVNERIHLSRKTRRWLRAVRHRVSTGRTPTISRSRLQGWESLRSMVEKQRESEAARSRRSR